MFGWCVGDFASWSCNKFRGFCLPCAEVPVKSNSLMCFDMFLYVLMVVRSWDSSCSALVSGHVCRRSLLRNRILGPRSRPMFCRCLTRDELLRRRCGLVPRFLQPRAGDLSRAEGHLEGPAARVHVQPSERIWFMFLGSEEANAHCKVFGFNNISSLRSQARVAHKPHTVPCHFQILDWRKPSGLATRILQLLPSWQEVTALLWCFRTGGRWQCPCWLFLGVTMNLHYAASNSCPNRLAGCSLEDLCWCRAKKNRNI